MRHRCCPSSALCWSPKHSYKADDRTRLYTEKVYYCCSSSNPNSRTWITLGKHALPTWKRYAVELPSPGGGWGIFTHVSNPKGLFCTWKSLRWLRLHHLEMQSLACKGKLGPCHCTVEIHIWDPNRAIHMGTSLAPGFKNSLYERPGAGHFATSGCQSTEGLKNC